MYKRVNIRRMRGDNVTHTVCLILLSLCTLVFIYPVIYIISVSFSSADAVQKREIWLLPVRFSLSAYRLCFEHDYLFGSFGNAFLYSISGTVYSMLLTVFGAYALAHKQLRGRGIFTMLIFFTMLFSGGLIPTYLLVKDLKMVNTFWAMVIPCAVSQWNLIVMRTVFQENPESLEESAKIDGASHLTILFRIIIPISKPVIATIALLYFVGKWNDYFTALVYLNEKEKFPLQLIARELLVSFSDRLLNRNASAAADPNAALSYTPESFRAAVIVICVAPMMAIYPFLQRYFVKGIIVGAVKG